LRGFFFTYNLSKD